MPSSLPSQNPAVTRCLIEEVIEEIKVRRLGFLGGCRPRKWLLRATKVNDRAWRESRA